MLEKSPGGGCSYLHFVDEESEEERYERTSKQQSKDECSCREPKPGFLAIKGRKGEAVSRANVGHQEEQEREGAGSLHKDITWTGEA